MSGENKQLTLLDIIGIVSFVIGVANYEENVDQSSLQQVTDKAIAEIHAHLQTQDDKIDKILEALYERNTENGKANS